MGQCVQNRVPYFLQEATERRTGRHINAEHYCVGEETDHLRKISVTSARSWNTESDIGGAA